MASFGQWVILVSGRELPQRIHDDTSDNDAAAANDFVVQQKRMATRVVHWPLEPANNPECIGLPCVVVQNFLKSASLCWHSSSAISIILENILLKRHDTTEVKRNFLHLQLAWLCDCNLIRGLMLASMASASVVLAIWTEGEREREREVEISFRFGYLCPSVWVCVRACLVYSCVCVALV